MRVDGVLCSAPLWFRWDGATLWLVGSGASPVGEDHIRVRVDVGPGVAVAVRSVAATVVYAARGAGTRWDTDIHVADGARLDWRPEPVILTERARHEATTTVHAAAGADVTLDEVLVLGRAREARGHPPLHPRRARRRRTGAAHLDRHVASRLVRPRRRGRCGGRRQPPPPGRRVGARRLAAHAAAAPRCSEPAPGCRLAIATAADVADARRSLDAVLPD